MLKVDSILQKKDSKHYVQFSTSLHGGFFPELTYISALPYPLQRSCSTIFCALHPLKGGDNHKRGVREGPKAHLTELQNLKRWPVKEKK